MNNYRQKDAYAAPLNSLLPRKYADLKTIVHTLRHGFASLGIRDCVEYFDDWACVTVALDGDLLSFGVMSPEVPVLSPTALAIRVGVDLSFGLPSGEDLNERPGFFFYPPIGFTMQHLHELCRGRIIPAEFTSLLNHSNRHAMSSARKRFPESILLMVGSRNGVRDAGDHCFQLWTQSGGRVCFHQLELTNNPHQAALQANKLGYWPTIYRCISGVFVPFKSTSGGIFI